MFDQVLKIVRDHFNERPDINQAIPAGQAEDVHREVATHITDHLQNDSAATFGKTGLLNQIGAAFSSGNMLTNAIGGGLVSSLASKFGLPPAVTGAIAASLPALLQKLAHRNPSPQGNSL